MNCSHMGTRMTFTKLANGRDGWLCECGTPIRYVAGRPTEVPRSLTPNHLPPVKMNGRKP